jgi:tetratricopeptide (TPR) repeat protein
MVWPYLPCSEAFEHVLACAMDAPPSDRHMPKPANVVLQIEAFTDPFSRIDNSNFGCTYFYAREYDQALQQFQKAIQLNPDFFVAHYQLAWLYSQLGQYQDAITELTKGRQLSGEVGDNTAALEQASLRKALAAEGAKGFWQQIQTQKENHHIGEFGEARSMHGSETRKRR